MDRAASCRRAARDAVADVESSQLHDVITDTLEGASMTPGVLTLESAAAIDPTADLESIAHRAAGVQLIYEGLRLTRTLAHEEPWTAVDGDDGDADLEILAADILVARGFYLLARTDAAGKAVRTVRAFGRDQTLRDQSEADVERLDANLERDVLELAVVTGAATVGATPTAELLALANEISDAAGVDFPPAEECIPALDSSETDATAHETVRSDRATSATDP
ncbi:hypothetical protein ACFOZ7_09290 [Natribaculum luteum]|uniref:Uncharacterized protein n=1 Tax=Natribaculum luteum TaxID=1586232 RepID=A0ABD5NZH0_9EURY|nr:hypothetical protein [Natribaculum luteum]